MSKGTPKTSRGKKLHLVYFVDAARTHSVSINLRLLKVGAFLFIVVLVLAGVSFTLYLNGRLELATSQNYIRRLKSAVVAQAALHQKMMGEGLTNNPEVAHGALAASLDIIEKQARKGSLSSSSASEKGNPFLHHKLDDLAKLPENPASQPPVAPEGKGQDVALSAAPLAENDAPSGAAQAVSDKPAPQVTTAQPPPKLEQATKTVVPGPPTVNFQNFVTSGDGDKTVVQFDLVNVESQTSPNPRTVSGRVCVVAEVRPVVTPQAAGSAEEETEAEADEEIDPPSSQAPVTGPVTYPARLKLTPEKNPVQGCRGGQLVRFARLRPLSISLPVALSSVSRVHLYFSSQDRPLEMKKSTQELNTP